MWKEQGNSMDDLRIKRKIVLLGDSAVGKTSLIRRFVTDRFDDKYITTIGTKVTKKELCITKDDRKIDLTLMIWDVLGQKGYTNVQARSFQGADGVLYVCDLTRADSLDNINSYWLAELGKVASNVPAVLVGNKIDLQDERKVSDDMLSTFADQFKMPHYLSSAKTGENVERVFQSLGEQIAESYGKADASLKVIEEKDLSTLTAVTDWIMNEFVDSYGDQDTAMAIIRAQFSKAGINISTPTKESLLKAIELLAEAEKDVRPKNEVNDRLQKRKAMVGKCT
jgi:small GTP-binding protein